MLISRQLQRRPGRGERRSKRVSLDTELALHKESTKRTVFKPSRARRRSGLVVEHTSRQEPKTPAAIQRDKTSKLGRFFVLRGKGKDSTVSHRLVSEPRLLGGHLPAVSHLAASYPTISAIDRNKLGRQEEALGSHPWVSVSEDADATINTLEGDTRRWGKLFGGPFRAKHDRPVAQASVQTFGTKGEPSLRRHGQARDMAFYWELESRRTGAELCKTLDKLKEMGEVLDQVAACLPDIPSKKNSRSLEKVVSYMPELRRFGERVAQRELLQKRITQYRRSWGLTCENNGEASNMLHAWRLEGSCYC